MKGIDYIRLSKVERQEVLDQMRDLELCEFAGSIVLPVGHWEQIAMEAIKRLSEWAAPKTASGFPEGKGLKALADELSTLEHK